MDLAFDFGSRRQSLAVSPSIVNRLRPAASVSLSIKAKVPYVTQLISASDATLLSYSDDGFFRYHDKSTLSTQTEVKWERGGDCTCLISTTQGYMASGRNGVVGHWDSRDDKEQASLAGPSRAPYLSLAARDNLVAAGTELQGVDAAIDIWDLRKASKPVMSYVEAHSDDITSLSFHPTIPSVLLSASSDSLVAVSDVRKTDEDDSVLGVINTGSSVARIGWGGSSAIRPRAELEGEDILSSDLPAIGAFWSVSDMQTIGIWEADGWEEVLAPQDVRMGEVLMTPDWKTEFAIDASADSRLIQSKDSVGLFCGNQDGSTALIEIPNEAGKDWTIHCRLTGAHSEIVRSVLWDLDNKCLFTGAEDGQICAWQLTGLGASSPEVLLPNATSKQDRSTGAVKEERARTSYRPY
ncbi:hypothetical protein CBS101457_004080 [Exobasidium rhododendri]|nr:hypothetical protein CBS101457_004080 [Exobasidium rhododendri]